jgi:pimeloyl-ACP methyl ester carboxylesterase
MAREVREGQSEGGLPYLSFGEGPLVVFPGLGITNANPSGIQRWGEMRLLAPLARVFTVHRISRRVGLAGPLVIRRGWNPSDMISTIRAEDAFDIGGRLCEISAPTLVIGGGRDRFPTELFRETADGIPNAHLILYEDRAHGGTFADRSFGKDVLAFLLADQTPRVSW